MPLTPGSSDKTREMNIREMIDSGHPPAQAEAAAYREQRDSIAGNKSLAESMNAESASMHKALIADHETKLRKDAGMC
jgi:hypothetical protein